MSGKLDQSLDEILSTRRKNSARRGRGRRAPTAARVTSAAPAGGIRKNTKAKASAKAPSAASNVPTVGDSKIIVSGLVSLHIQQHS